MGPRTGWYASLALLVGACGRGDADAAIAALVERAEAAAEARDTGVFREIVADSYADAGGRTKDELIRLIRGYFIVNTDIEVMNRIVEVEVSGEDAAVVHLQTAVIGRARSRGLLGLDGDLRPIELELVREGRDWRIIGADWAEPAE